MACGCDMTPEMIAAARTESERQDAILRAKGADGRSRTLACHFCIYAEHGASAWGDGPVSCTIDLKPIANRTRCPKRKFKRKGGVQFIRSFWVWNRGAAWWQRKAVRACKATHPAYRVFNGCGCIDSLKRLSEWLGFAWSVARVRTCFDARY